MRGCYSWPGNYPPKLNVEYSFTGGIWVLRVRNGEFGPDDWARVSVAFTIDERCAILGEMGATFCTLVDDCPDIAKFLEVGMAIGRQGEVLMKEIDA